MDTPVELAAALKVEAVIVLSTRKVVAAKNFVRRLPTAVASFDDVERQAAVIAHGPEGFKGRND